MITYTGLGSRWAYTNNSAAIVSGQVIVLLSGGAVGTVNLGIAVDAISSSGNTGVLQIAGRFSLPKTAGEAYTVGQALYWNSATSAITSASTGNTFAGQAIAGQASGDANVDILLNSIPYSE